MTLVHDPQDTAAGPTRPAGRVLRGRDQQAVSRFSAPKPTPRACKGRGVRFFRERR